MKLTIECNVSIRPDATQEQLDAEEEAAWEDDADEDTTDDGTTDDATGTPPAQPVPLIRDVPPATTGTP